MSHLHYRFRGDKGQHLALHEDTGEHVIAFRYVHGGDVEQEVLTKAEWESLPLWEGPHPAEFETAEEGDG